MGLASEMMIEEHNERMETDAQYAADYEESMQMDAALEAEWFERERMREMEIDWFSDVRIDCGGYEEIIEETEIRPALIDDDIPF